ncbi:MAG TPA: MMPL family transporter [Dehalococcoidia bacterium]|nr:MMPL family transporter [Dehalococcoidia bacterium]
MTEPELRFILTTNPGPQTEVTAPTNPSTNSVFFDRWPRIAYRHPWHILLAAAAVLAACGFAYSRWAGHYAESLNLPGTESQQFNELMESRFPQSAGDPATVVVRVDGHISDPQNLQRVGSLVSDLKALPQVVSVTSPFEQTGAISLDGSIARINVQYEKRARALDRSSIDALLDLRRRDSIPGFQVEAGGQVPRAGEVNPPKNSELIGLSAAVVILLIAFGSVVAMGLPIVTALIALLTGLALIGVTASIADLPEFTTEFAAMIGIGAGIDYALLIVTRFREGLARGLGLEDAVIEAASTAGRSVVFAGSTVIIALLGLWAIGIPSIAYAGSAAAFIVGLSVLVAVLVLPALLRLVGKGIDRWRIPVLAARPDEAGSGMGYRLSRLIQRSPVAALVISLGILLTLATPVLSMELGTADSGNDPESFTSRRAYDLLSQGFGPGFNGPALVGVAINGPEDAEAVTGLAARLALVSGVAGVAPPRFNAEKSAAVITVMPTTSPQSHETQDLVNRLRNAITTDTAGTGIKAYVGGSVAMHIDATEKMASRMPFLIAAVIGLSFILLMMVFRSVLVALKAAVMNLLSIGAAYGVLVAVFQWGWLAGPLGVQRQGPIESFMPVMLFAILFGLSMDYEVFLISRIREEYIKTGNNSEAVARGLSVTTRVISAAAAIMVAVFMSFALGDQRVVKEFGIGLATAVFVDATLVRLVLVPALMQLMGNANWWFPRWADRLLPRISVDGRPQTATPASSTGAGGR